MRICLTVNSSPWSRFKGGGQIAVHHLASALADRGHEVHVIYSKTPDEKINRDELYRIHWARHFNLATINLNIFSFAYELWQLTGRLQFDVVHGNAEEAFFFSIISRIRRIKFFFTSHAPFVPETGFLGGLIRPAFFLKHLNSYLLRSAAKSACLVFAFSEFSRGLIATGIGKTAKVRVVHPGVDPGWLGVDRSPTASPQFIFWGRMEDEKGILEALEAICKVKAVQPEIVFHMIGEGGRLEFYKRRADELGLMDAVTFHGWMEAREIRRLAAVCKAGIFPSRIESFGLAVVEAMAAGLPVIVTRAGALPEIVEDGLGLLVPKEDPEFLAKAILNLLANSPKYEKMAEYSRGEIRRKFSWNLTSEKTLSYYLE